MNKHTGIVFLFCLLLVYSVHPQPTKPVNAAEFQSTRLQHVRLTVLADNMSGFGPVLGEWGASFLIETEKDQILFDTGAGQVLEGNAKALDVELSRCGAIVISHGHEDHTGGLAKALAICGRIDLFVHPSALSIKYWKMNSGAVESRFPFSRQELEQRLNGLYETVNPTQIREGLQVTGQIPRLTDFEDTGVKKYAFLDRELTIPDQILDDQALFFKVPEGIVILLGCGHAGVVNTMEYVSQLTGEQRIYAVIGGTHLHSASPVRLQRTIEAFNKYQVQKIMLSHCTGLKIYAALDCALPGRCSWPETGTVIEFGSSRLSE